MYLYVSIHTHTYTHSVSQWVYCVPAAYPYLLNFKNKGYLLYTLILGCKIPGGLGGQDVVIWNFKKQAVT